MDSASSSRPLILLLYLASLLFICSSYGTRTTTSVGRFDWRASEEEGAVTLRVDAWGRDSLRVRISNSGQTVAVPPVQALLPEPHLNPGLVIEQSTKDMSTVSNGNLRATIDTNGLITFNRISDGRLLLRTVAQSFGPVAPPPEFPEKSSDPALPPLQSATIRFAPISGEKIYGLGEHRTGSVQNKPISLIFQRSQIYDYSHGGDISIPFYSSTQGYGYLWNLPSFGYVVINDSYTEWFSNSTYQIDYWITTNAPGHEKAPFPDLMQRYVDATGHPPVLPEFASGFWQCKNRYRNQTEFMDVAQGYLNRSLPISVIVVDYFHWVYFGDWAFNPKCWPNPSSMVSNLNTNGIEVMVSVWPRVENASSHFTEMFKNSYLVKNSKGEQYPFVGAYYYDPFNADARKYVFDALVDGYASHGIKVFWLDSDEPERKLPDQSGQFYYDTTMRDLQVGMAFPRMHQQMVYDGFQARKETDIFMLSRSAWAGTQRYASAVWSGDIDSTFAELAIQVKVAQNVAMSGIYWWTTDIGGYYGGNLGDPMWRELIVRWFQFGAFCPLFRLHGYRFPTDPSAPCGDSGGLNEVWEFGDTAYAIIPDIMRLREQLRPYIMKHMTIAAETGIPVLRPMFFEFPEQPASFLAEDQFMFGPEWLVAPVTQYQATSRNVFLPALPPSEVWVHHYTQKAYQGGQTLNLYSPPTPFPTPTLTPYTAQHLSIHSLYLLAYLLRAIW